MSFLTAGFLFGLAAIAVPLILHLIQRQRYPERRFTTLRFFDVTIKHNVLQRRLIDRLLLALRILLLAALMLALGRPFWRGGIFGERRAATVIVLDNSPSMGRMLSGETLFEHARRAARAVVGETGGNDRLALLLTAPLYAPDFTTNRAALTRQLDLRAGQPTVLLTREEEGAIRPVLPELVTDPALLRRALAALPPAVPAALAGEGVEPLALLQSDRPALVLQIERARLSAGAGNLAATVERAGRLLADAREGDRTVIVLSDLQASDWGQPPALALDGIHVRLLPLAPAVETAPNLALEDCTPTLPVARFGDPLTCTARVRNCGTAASASSARISVQVGEQRQLVQFPLPPLAAGAAALVPFTVPVAGRGATLFCTVSIESPSDPFAYDNTRYLQVPIQPPLRVLCVHGDLGGDDPARASGFFAVNALAPRTVGAGAFAEVEACAAEELGTRELFQYSVVLLAGVRTLDEPQRARLRAFADDGGGLLVFPDAAVAADEYNAWGFLPARLTELKTGDFTYVARLNEEDPVMGELARRAAGSLAGLSASTWTRLEVDPEATVLATFANGAPAIAGAARGKGRVALAAAGCHVDAGSDWPLRPAFVLLLRGLVDYVSGAAPGATTGARLSVGDAMARSIPAEMPGGTPGAFRMELASGSLAYEPLPWYRHAQRLQLPPPAAPGHYLLSVQPTVDAGLLTQPGLGASRVSVALNPVGVESTFVPATAATIGGALKGADVETVMLEGGILAAPVLTHTGRELWRYLAFAALALVVAESLVGWRSVSGASK